MLDPKGMVLIGQIIFQKIKALKVDAVGGLAMGAVPISIATSYASSLKNKPIKSFFVRKQAKGHGTTKQIEGHVHPGERVIIVDDVITTGNSVIEAIHAARDCGLKIVKVTVLVDREEEKGKQRIEQELREISEIPEVESIFTMKDLMRPESNERNSQGRLISETDRATSPIM
jgi:orotate phosphoribosyltransferase